ncbi:MAG: tetratricopeptide repeat protein [Gemmatimonadetes bacterium]|nr:tetratricopeptide repeat protein [Gemmatimonadota bacterium]
MNKARFGLAFMAAATVAVAGCASGSGGSSGGGDEGNRPEENTHTRSAQLFLTQAQTMGDAARYDQAYEAAVQSIQTEPMNPLGFFQAGQAEVGRGNYEAADTLFEKALELYPAYEEDVGLQREAAWIDLFNQAIEPMNQGNYQEGVRLLEAAEEMYPSQRPEALINLGVGHANLNNMDAAIDAYSSALDVIRGPATAAADSATAANWRESEASVAFNLANLLSQAERYEEAAAEYRAYLENNPGDVSAQSNLAAVFASAGQPDSAQAIYDDLLSQPNLGMRDLFNIGVGLYQSGVFDRAAEAFGTVAETAPENRDAVYNWAQSLYDGEDWEGLVPVGQRLVELDPNNSNSYTLLAKALIETGQEQEAVRMLETGRDLPFTVQDTQIRPDPAGGATVTGQLVNNTLDAGSTVTLRFHFSAEDGAELGTTDVRIPAPDAGMAEVFRAEFASTETVMGYYVQVVN